jgi:crotonobetainyl-CoA:carnitine CoA-transferase CaiB-like acyl-CoA transferase
MSGPLDGIRVVEIGTLIAAPFAGRILAEFGADVIKIEAPNQGDPLRKWRKLHKDTSLWWYLQSRNKKSIAIDLKNAAGVDVVRRLVRDADILIENMRPGGLEKLGLGWDVLSKINPGLTMVRISGYGQTGPYRDRPGFGAIGEAMGGIRYTTGSVEAPPTRVGVSLGDSLGSLYGVVGALMSLLQVKTRNQPGQVVDVSLFESVFSLMETLVPEYDLFGYVRERSGGSLPGISPSNTYCSRDGQYVVIAGNSDPIFKRLMGVIGRIDLANDRSLERNDGRVAKNDMIDKAISAWTASHDIRSILEQLEQAEIPAGRIYSAADIVADPHYHARGMILPAKLPDGVEVKMPGIVPKMSRTPGEVRWLGPTLGQHTTAVLHELRYNEAEITRLFEKGAVQ